MDNTPDNHWAVYGVFEAGTKLPPDSQPYASVLGSVSGTAWLLEQGTRLVPDGKIVQYFARTREEALEAGDRWHEGAQGREHAIFLLPVWRTFGVRIAATQDVHEEMQALVSQAQEKHPESEFWMLPGHDYEQKLFLSVPGSGPESHDLEITGKITLNYIRQRLGVSMENPIVFIANALGQKSRHELLHSSATGMEQRLRKAMGP